MMFSSKTLLKELDFSHLFNVDIPDSKTLKIIFIPLVPTLVPLVLFFSESRHI